MDQVSARLRDNIEWVDATFGASGDIVKKKFTLKRHLREIDMYVVYIDGLCNEDIVEATILKPLLYEWNGNKEEDIRKEIYELEAQTVDIKEKTELSEVALGIAKGDTAFFIDGVEVGYVVSTKKFPLRGIADNDKEPVLRGPRDSFNEGFRSSTALIRRRIRDPRLRIEQGIIGERTKTDYALCYIEGIVMEGLLDEIRKRLDEYIVDGVFDSGMMEQILTFSEKGRRNSTAFPLLQSTTRPDKAASAILEGRVVIVVDNSPEVIIAPANVNMFFQSSEDYYNASSVAVFSRIIRYIAAFVAIGAPGFYIAITMYHTAIIPEKLLYAIVAARSAVTFPVFVEVMIMELFFELLREAGLRLPGQLGSTIGVVGGLIVGQAAVDAGLVSTIVVIVVALGAISSFALTNEEFASIFRLYKFAVIIASGLMGLYGFILSMILLGSHLAGLTSFGIPYLMPASGDVEGSDARNDFIFRAHMLKMRKRPYFAADRLRVRRKHDNRE